MNIMHTNERMHGRERELGGSVETTPKPSYDVEKTALLSPHERKKVYFQACPRFHRRENLVQNHRIYSRLQTARVYFYHILALASTPTSATETATHAAPNVFYTRLPNEKRLKNTRCEGKLPIFSNCRYAARSTAQRARAALTLEVDCA